MNRKLKNGFYAFATRTLPSNNQIDCAWFLSRARLVRVYTTNATIRSPRDVHTRALGFRAETMTMRAFRHVIRSTLQAVRLAERGHRRVTL